MTNKFKLLGLLLFFVTPSLMVSCNKENKENEASNVSIVGDWECTKGDVYDIQENIMTHTGVGHTLKLSEDGKWYEDGVFKGYYVTVGSNNITLNKDEGVTNSRFAHQYTYIVSSSNLKLDYISSTWELHFEFNRL